MNDFTKDELQEIARCTKYMIKGGTTPFSVFTLKVHRKLLSMIDNYCEHSETVGYYEWTSKCANLQCNMILRAK